MLLYMNSFLIYRSLKRQLNAKKKSNVKNERKGCCREFALIIFKRGGTMGLLLWDDNREY